MIRHKSQAFALVLSVAAFLILGVLFVKPNLPDLPPYLSSSADLDGVKGLYELLDSKESPVKSWRHPWQYLPNRQGQALIVIEPPTLSDKERQDMRRWLEQGNELLIFQSKPEGWNEFPLRQLDKSLTGVVAVTDLQRPNTGGLTGKPTASVRLEERPQLQALLKDDQGILAGRVQVGQGSLTLLLVPDWTRNDTIVDQSHFELLWPQLYRAGRTAVWFDDYHHGAMTKPGLLDVFPGWLLAALLQLVIASLLFLWMKAIRFGPAYTPRFSTVRRGDEILLAASGWYERNKLAYEALVHQERYIRRLLSDRWGVRMTASDSQLLLAAKQRWEQASVDQFAELLKAWKDAEDARVYSSARLEKDSRKADAIIWKLERE